MTKNDCIVFANNNPNCFLATIDGNQPRVRTIMLMFADETGFYFETFPNKEMSKQMHTNAKVEICFTNNSNDFTTAKQMRISGEIEFVNDPIITDKVYEKVKGLESLTGGSFKHLLEVYKLSSGNAHFWTFNDVGKESEIKQIKF